MDAWRMFGHNCKQFFHVFLSRGNFFTHHNFKKCMRKFCTRYKICYNSTFFGFIRKKENIRKILQLIFFLGLCMVDPSNPPLVDIYTTAFIRLPQGFRIQNKTDCENCGGIYFPFFAWTQVRKFQKIFSLHHFLGRMAPRKMVQSHLDKKKHNQFYLDSTNVIFSSSKVRRNLIFLFQFFVFKISTNFI